MKKLFKYLDRTLMIVLAVLAGLFIGVNVIWVRSVNGTLAEQTKQISVATQQRDSLQTHLAQIKTAGIIDTSALFSRIGRLEALVPSGVDDLTLVQIIVSIAQDSGVTLSVFQLAAATARPVDPDTTTAAVASAPSSDQFGILYAVRYMFTINGPYGAVLQFITNIMSSDSFVATVDSITFTPAVSNASAASPSIFDSQVNTTGSISIWAISEAALSLAEGAPATTTTLVQTDTTVPTDPATPTDTAAPTGSTAPPGSSVPVPVPVTTLP